MKKFILASNSPRRREILHAAGYEFDVIPSKVPEKECHDIPPEVYVQHLAESKAEDVYNREKRPCLGADTIVVLDGKILEKPLNRSVNAQYLRNLSGRGHDVFTGYCFIEGGKKICGYDRTVVVFNSLSDSLIEEYVSKGLGLDKAGGYGIQDGFDLVSEIQGSFYNVVGLPIEKINEILKEYK